MDSSQWIQGIGGVVKPMEDSSKRAHHKDQILNCPRCNSTNTKFCYYNNYSLSQPRYFCKTCRRYWTEGGSLRNVPVGGGSRKNKRSSSSSSSLSSNKLHDNNHLVPLSLPSSSQNPKINDGQDLNLPSSQSSKGLSSFIPMATISNGFPQPTLNFCLDGYESGYGNMQEMQENGARVLFPIEDMKQVSNLAEFEQIRWQGDCSNGYWNVMLGGGSW